MGTFRAPRRRSARSAARRPTCSGLSSPSTLRAMLNQKSRSMEPFCFATGTADNGATAAAIASEESERIGEHVVPRCVSHDAPSELTMRGSALRAAASACFAHSIFRAAGRVHHGVGVQTEVLGDLAQLRFIRQTREWVFRRDLGQFEGGLHHLANAVVREI